MYVQANQFYVFYPLKTNKVATKLQNSLLNFVSRNLGQTLCKQIPLWNEIIVSLISSIIWTLRPFTPMTKKQNNILAKQ